jgi:hypothetical protein
MQLLETHFAPADLETILNIPLCTRRQEDSWAWHYEKMRVFSVRSAYRMLVINKHHATAYLESIAGRSDVRAEEKEWSAIWKLNIPSKIRIFLWRLAKHSVSLRGMSSVTGTWHSRALATYVGYRIPGSIL